MGCSQQNEVNISSSSSSSPTSTTTIAPLIPNSNNYLPRNTNLLPLCHHQGNERKNEEIKRRETVGGSRWNPTPEQLLALEEIYRQGTRTPTSEEIQQIASQLRRFGKIEGKNVFYWFQNHKARERQKRRREKEILMMFHCQQQQQFALQLESGLRTTGYEVEQTKNWTLSSNCSKQSEESTTNVVHAADSGVNGPHMWIQQFDEKELHQRKKPSSSSSSVMTINAQDHIPATWQTPRETQTLQLFPINNEEENEEEKLKNKKPLNNPKFIEFLPLKN